MNQLPVYQIYKIKGSNLEFNSIQEAAIKVNNLSLNKNYPSKEKFYSDYDQVSQYIENTLFNNIPFKRDTMFNEIYCTHHKLNKTMYELIKKPRLNIEENPKVIGRKMYEAISSYIFNNWDPLKIHLMTHSSGLDSRIVSVILNNLRNEHGEEWLGKLFFVCWEPEINNFKKIMEHQEWETDKLICIEKENLIDYYSEFLDFNFIGKNYSETGRLLPQEGLFHKVADSLGTPDEIQVITGNHSDELLIRTWNNYAHFFMTYLSKTSQKRSRFSSCILPFISYDLLNCLINYKTDKTKRIEIKKEIINCVDPIVSEFENFCPQIYRKDNIIECELLSQETINKMRKDYENSWYYKITKNKIDIFPTQFIYHRNENNYYMKSAICEYLIRNNCIIKY